MPRSPYSRHVQRPAHLLTHSSTGLCAHLGVGAGQLRHSGEEDDREDPPDCPRHSARQEHGDARDGYLEDMPARQGSQPWGHRLQQLGELGSSLGKPATTSSNTSTVPKHTQAATPSQPLLIPRKPPEQASSVVTADPDCMTPHVCGIWAPDAAAKRGHAQVAIRWTRFMVAFALPYDDE